MPTYKGLHIAYCENSWQQKIQHGGMSRVSPVAVGTSNMHPDVDSNGTTN
jgi:hypothetical protein